MKIRKMATIFDFYSIDVFSIVEMENQNPCICRKENRVIHILKHGCGKRCSKKYSTVVVLLYQSTCQFGSCWRRNVPFESV